MQITQLYTYPIKSLRGILLKETQVSPQGFPYDRRFMLYKIHRDDETTPTKNARLEKMVVSTVPQMTLFMQEIQGYGRNQSVLVSYIPPNKADCKEIAVPLTPEIDNLEIMDVELHSSPTKAYNMGEHYNSWFSARFGYEVVFVYLGPNHRPVLGNLSPNATSKTPPQQQQAEPRPWYSSIANSIPTFGVSSRSPGGIDEGITFADVAPYLVVTEESLKDISSRLPDGQEMDITKLRPNIVLSGSLNAFEEDFWGGVVISADTADGGRDVRETELVLTQNCARCRSIDIDYATGDFGTGEAGTVLKKMMRDRRVDKGWRYSPIFGRYGFLKFAHTVPRIIKVGDKVEVSKRNVERTTFREFSCSVQISKFNIKNPAKHN